MAMKMINSTGVVPSDAPLGSGAYVSMLH
jgi:hypothetical protein